MEQEDYVSYELAKAIQNKTKHYFTTQYFYYNGKFVDINDYNPRRMDEVIQAPSLHDAQKWLRKQHHIYVNVQELPYNIPEFGVSWSYRIACLTSMKDYTSKSLLMFSQDYSSYEECLNEGIKKALELIKV